MHPASGCSTATGNHSPAINTVKARGVGVSGADDVAATENGDEDLASTTPSSSADGGDDSAAVDLEATLCAGDLRQSPQPQTQQPAAPPGEDEAAAAASLNWSPDSSQSPSAQQQQQQLQAAVQRSFSSVSGKRLSPPGTHQRSASDLHAGKPLPPHLQHLVHQYQQQHSQPVSRNPSLREDTHPPGHFFHPGVLLNPAGIPHCSSFSSLSSLVSASTELSLPEDRLSLQDPPESASSSPSRRAQQRQQQQPQQLEQPQPQHHQQPGLLQKLFGWREKWTPAGAACNSFASSMESRQVSTLGLIAVDRPSGAPPKDLTERERHLREYQEMLRNAQRKDADDLERRRKDSDRNRRLESQAQKLIDTWEKKVLPNWQEFLSREPKKFRNLCWHGIPSKLRPQVWFRLLSNELRITEELFDIHVTRARDMALKQQLQQQQQKQHHQQHPGTNNNVELERTAEMNYLKLISLDVSRTLPDIKLFQRGGPYHDRLFDLLAAYVSFSPDTGYVQGMSFICAVLLLNCSSDYCAFVSFANLLSRPCLRAHYRFDERLMRAYELTFEALLAENLPRLSRHFQLHEFHMRPILTDWVFTVFAKNLPYDLACRIWDMFAHDGDPFLYRAALGVLRMHENRLLLMDYSQMMELLKSPLPDLEAESIFGNVEAIAMRIESRDFATIFEQCIQDLNSDRASLSS